MRPIELVEMELAAAVQEQAENLEHAATLLLDKAELMRKLHVLTVTIDVSLRSTQEYLKYEGLYEELCTNMRIANLRDKELSAKVQRITLEWLRVKQEEHKQQ